jgi:hypothetical protein
MNDDKLANALVPYKIIEKINSTLFLEYAQSLHKYIYIWSSVWAGIFILFGKKLIELPIIVPVIFISLYIVFCILFRFLAIRNPIFIDAKKGLLKLTYKNFLLGEREVSYNSQVLKVVRPSPIAVKLSVTASIEVYFDTNKYVEFIFANSEKSLGIQRSKDIALLFSQVLGIQLQN